MANLVQRESSVLESRHKWTGAHVIVALKGICLIYRNKILTGFYLVLETETQAVMLGKGGATGAKANLWLILSKTGPDRIWKRYVFNIIFFAIITVLMEKMTAYHLENIFF